MFKGQFKLHPATDDGFPDALATSFIKRSHWNSREPAYTRIFTRFFTQQYVELLGLHTVLMFNGKTTKQLFFLYIYLKLEKPLNRLNGSVYTAHLLCFIFMYITCASFYAVVFIFHTFMGLTVGLLIS